MICPNLQLEKLLLSLAVIYCIKTESRWLYAILQKTVGPLLPSVFQTILLPFLFPILFLKN